MAAPKKTTETPNPATPENENGQTTGNHDPSAYASGDSALAEAAGITEGEVHALRDDAGLNQSAGHMMDIHAYGLTPAGKKFAEGEKDRVKAAKDEAKRYEEQSAKDGLTEAEAKYVEAVNKA